MENLRDVVSFIAVNALITFSVISAFYLYIKFSRLVRRATLFTRISVKDAYPLHHRELPLAA